MKNREIMTSLVRCVRPSDTLAAAATIMRDYDVGALPVCETDRKPTGFLTDRDLAIRATAEGLDPNETKVEDVMSPSVVFVFADQDVNASAQLMEQYQIRRLPVLDHAQFLVGIISLADFASHLEPVVAGGTLKQVSRPGSSYFENPATI